MSKITSRELIRRIKPLLSSQPVFAASIDASINGEAELTVKFIVTDDLLSALSGIEDLSLIPDNMDGT